MDNNRRSIFGGYGGMDPSLNVPVTLSPGSSAISPYLNFDPSILTPSGADSQFILMEGASERRGRFELAFSQIGGSVIGGAAFGGVNGILSGWKATRSAQLTGAIRRTQMLNYIAKQGAGSAQTLGVIALMYSIFGVILSKSRGADDEINTLVAGTATGLFFKSTSGWRRCLRAGGVGFSIATVYCILTSRDRLKQIYDTIQGGYKY